MKKFNLTLIVAATLLTACTRDFDKFDVRNPIPAEDANSINFTIPIEEAIEELNSVLDAIDEQQMAAGGGAMVMAMNNRRQIDKVSVVYSNMPILQKGSTTSPTGMQKAPATTYKDSLLYVVDFKDNKGCAVLAADRRIPETVLAITETGSFNNMDKNMFPPTYKQGMYADSELMKGFSLYDAEVDDYYVASNFISPLEFCKDYANFHIQLVHKEFNPLPKGSYLEHGKWEVKEKIAPMLITIWHQGSPFNDEAPELSWFSWQKWKLRSPAGCFPIAIAQIIAYHEKKIECYGYRLNWESIKRDIWSYNNRSDSSASNTDKKAIALFLQFLATHCKAIRTPDFTFVFPHKARIVMEKFYRNLKTNEGCNLSLLLSMLRNNKPVLVCAISGIVDGHAWVVDGYLYRKRKVKDVQLGEGELPNSISEYEEEQKLVHCNWGWKGYCNGYYMPEIFNIENGAEAVENGLGEKSDNKTDCNFTWFTRTITYDK